MERFGIHRLHEVVNQEQEQAAKYDQAHHSQEDKAADKEGVHDLQRMEKTNTLQLRSAPGAWKEHAASWKRGLSEKITPGGKTLGFPQISPLAFHS